MKRVLTILLMALTSATLLFGGLNKSDNQLRKTSSPTVINDIWMDANRMNGVMRNNGVWYYDYIAGDWGLEWPKGSGLSPIFAGGQWVGAKVNGEVKIAGTQHSATEFQPGEIQNGVATNPLDAAYRWYVIEPDGVGDWANWPVSQGAPVDSLGQPLLIGDKTAFCVYNDLAPHDLFATNKLGVEIRQTVFAFNRADAIGDMTFFKWQIVNKSDAAWDSTYLSIWTDPDLGEATDDFVGCDPELGLGYCYNADNDDQNYGAAPPAVGVDFFQGPIVDETGSTVTLPGGIVIADKKMLKMTAFTYYNNDDSPQGNPHSGQDVWNFQTGFWRDGSAILNPEGVANPFMFDGDPQAGSGWLDTDEYDRRFLMTTGPFTMPKWVDTNANGLPDFGEPGVQEIVAGVLVGRGGDNLGSVGFLKAIDGIAQQAYDNSFALPKPPKPPVVAVSQTPNAVTLTWDEKSEFESDGVTPYEQTDVVANGLMENAQSMVVDGEYTLVIDGAYNFTDYRVYQFVNAQGDDPVLVDSLGAYKLMEFAPYTGARYYRLSVNKHSKVGLVGSPLVNGKPYYFGIQANAYCKFASPQILSSPMVTVTVVPQFTPGVRVTSAFGDTIQGITHAGPSDGSVEAYVVDPTKVTGASYNVTFNEDLSWNLIKGQADTLQKNQTNQRGDDAYNVNEGIIVKVMGPVPGMKSWGIPSGTRRFSPVLGFTGLGLEGFSTGGAMVTYDTDNGTIGMAGNFAFGGIGTNLGVTDYRNVVLKLAAVDNVALWDPKTTPTDPNFSKGYRWLRAVGATSTPADPSFEPWIVNKGGGYPYQDYNYGVPFSAWNMETNPPTRLMVGHFENNVAGGLLDGRYWPGHASDPDLDNVTWREFAFIFNVPYSETPDPNLMINLSNSVSPLMWVMTCVRRSDVPWPGNDEFQINASHVNSTADVFSFTSPAPATVTVATKKEDLGKVNVVPNPYYGYHSGEMDPYNRWVQFTFLPEKCTIRIFDLAGSLIRILEKNDATTPFLQWDLKNEMQLPVASGIYVYHVEAPGLGNKVGKMAIFTPNERLDAY